jgi:hypothetical protein
MMSKEEMDRYWREDQRFKASIPAMPRHEYLKKYPNGAPDHFSGSARGADFVEWYSAIKRRRKEARRPGWRNFWWAMVGLAFTFVITLFVANLSQAIMLVFALVLCYCFIEMGMNLPPR